MSGLRLSQTQTIAILAVQGFFLALPLMTSAATCCICTHPQVKNGKFCIKNATTCSTLNSSANQELKDISCTDDTSANACKKVPAGQCIADPYDELAFKLANVPGYSSAAAPAAAQPPALTFTPNVDIPGLTMFAPYSDNNEVIVPMLAQYIQAMQKLLIGVGLVAAAIMIMYGGFLYIVSGTGAKVQEGKKVIIDALIGLIILLGAVVILSNLNPNTTTLGALHLVNVNPSLYSPVTSDQYASAASLLGTNPNMPSPTEMLTAVKEKAKEKGIDPCIAWAIMSAESGGKLIIGHDEDWFVGGDTALTQSRVDFMRSRKFYSGKEFPKEIPIMPANCEGADRAACNSVAGYKPTGSSGIVMNDDEPKFDQPPDFGLDWRFSHGFGGGLTIFPDSKKCPNGWRGYTVNGKCFSVPELVTKDGQTEALLASSAFWQNGQTGGKPVNDPMSVFKGWAGCQDSASAKIPCSKVQKILDIKKKYYDTCKALEK